MVGNLNNIVATCDFTVKELIGYKNTIESNDILATFEDFNAIIDGYKTVKKHHSDFNDISKLADLYSEIETFTFELKELTRVYGLKSLDFKKPITTFDIMNELNSLKDKICVFIGILAILGIARVIPATFDIVYFAIDRLLEVIIHFPFSSINYLHISKNVIAFLVIFFAALCFIRCLERLGKIGGPTRIV